MAELPDDPIGTAWLIANCDVAPMARPPVLSRIGGRRATETIDGYRLETYPELMRPTGDIAAHLQFHLRHEVPQLEFLARLFARSGPGFVQDWIDSEPTGQYARRAAFLYEWLTDGELSVPERLGGNYVDVLDDAKVVTSSRDRIVKNPRWRVNDNLPGTRYFCPTLVKTASFMEAAELNVPRLFADLAAEFGEDLLMRAAAWMTLRESKASFAIEGEADRTSRIQRFADVMARRTAQGEQPLSDDAAAELQREILGERTTLTHFGFRQSPVFVGETVRYNEVVHYVAPGQEDVPAMLDGLRTFLARTSGQSSVMRSTVAAFGFVYVHPLADGNGRVHRFLINDVLRRDGVIPEPVILPVSAVIMDDAGERRGYDRVLDQVSAPLMEHVRDHIVFDAAQTTYPDGVVSNFAFDGAGLAMPLWRYPDLSPHVQYLANIVKRTLTEHMREESRYLRSHALARQVLKEIVEMPDHQADRVLRSIEQNQGQLSNVLAKEMPILQQPGIWPAIVEAVSSAFRNGDSTDAAIVDRYRPERPAGQ
ncbi:cell filamentation protein Fic [Burkholderia sp. Ac-20384]|uniref:Fic family protein n=1 Tax=Burkholderia sp. Ac-20384 TaxID=2703902 RepID=UPI00197D2A4E|nr:Fic family protein [Burkholderia sp. Ac-20384]MBN3828807.1 cell filamentation protein Fic [Burkholderia sp. Ac-20384]